MSAEPGPRSSDGLFPHDIVGLPHARPTEVIEVADGGLVELPITPVVNRLGDDDVRMIGYGGSIPGPTIRVVQGSSAEVRVRNDADHETTVHWHGLRLANAYDGVPGQTQDPIPVGGEFVYELEFPDAGLYWYHPHVREDYGLEMGLYGNIVVDPRPAEAWPAVDREAIITLDDVLLEDGRIGPFHRDGPTYTAMGRFGNVMLTGGLTHLRLAAKVGEVVRLFLTNTANTRIFNLAVAGARMKLVGGDSGRYEREAWVDSVLLAPSERAIVDVRFDTPGSFPLEHRPPGATTVLGAVEVEPDEAARPSSSEFEVLHTNDELVAERDGLGALLARSPDKTLVFDALMPILYGDGHEAEASSWVCPMHPEVRSDQPGVCPQCGMKLVPAEDDAPPAHEHHGAHGDDSDDGIEWEDLMPDINARTDATNMIWKIVDADTGQENTAIDWSFRVGDRVKIRLINTMESEHPMHHPFHVHGAGRFLVVARDDVPEPNLVWKDTVLVRAGETVDIALDLTNPGVWMAHCHIAEHNQVGMMFNFRVTP